MMLACGRGREPLASGSIKQRTIAANAKTFSANAHVRVQGEAGARTYAQQTINSRMAPIAAAGAIQSGAPIA
jgi:hypothetical protein